MALELAASPAPDELEPVDDFGFDRRFTERMLPLATWLYRKYWRGDTEGIAHVPGTGPALPVANQRRVIPHDGAKIRTALRLQHPKPPHPRNPVVNRAFVP